MPVTSQPRRWYSLQCYAVAMYFLTELSRHDANQSYAKLCHRTALLNQTIPLRCPSMRHCSIALLLPALPLHPAAQLIYAMPMPITASLCQRPSTLNQTMPTRIATRPCQTMPLRLISMLIRCSALPNYADACYLFPPITFPFSSKIS